MKNEKGTVLLLTLIFVLGFTMFGFASLFWGTTQNEATERQKLSTEAFWLADGGIEEGWAQLPTLINRTNNLGNGLYSIMTTNQINGLTYTERWQADSEGYINQGLDEEQKRGILAIISNYNFDDALKFKGNASKPCRNNGDLQGSGDVGADLNHDGTIDLLSCDYMTENDPGLNSYDPFGEFFNGKDYITVRDSVTPSTVTNPIYVPAGLTVIKSNSNVDIKKLYYSGPSDSAAFLIIDVPANKSVSIVQNGFKGIIWITGSLDKISSENNAFKGTIFVNNSSTAKITGGDFIFDPIVVDRAVHQLPPSGPGGPQKPEMISWREKTQGEL